MVNGEDLKQDYEKKSTSLPNGMPLKLEGLDLKVFARVEVFYVCSHCGHIYWDGCHHDRYKRKVQEMLFESDTKRDKSSPKSKAMSVDETETRPGKIIL
jgi:hypothetical protein